MSETDDILVRIEGKIGRVTLNRPKALNALTYDMAMALGAALDTWADDDNVAMLLIDAEGDRAFCAGGDISALYQRGMAGDYDYARTFWADEYRVNAKIAAFPKPYVAIMDGIVMGGGVGVSAHGTHRIVTERTMLAMPECAIGLIPDVGGTHLLGKAPGHIGEYLGLTGARIGAADAIHAGFADVFVPSEKLAALKDALVQSGDPAIIADFTDEPPTGILAAIQPDIDAAFSANSVVEARKRLSDIDAEWAAKAAKAIDAGSPISVLCTAELVRGARECGELIAALQHEYRFVSRCMEHGDFLEGIRAAIIDKDRNPKFRWPGIKALTTDEVAFMLSEPDGGDISI